MTEIARRRSSGSAWIGAVLLSSCSAHRPTVAGDGAWRDAVATICVEPVSNATGLIALERADEVFAPLLADALRTAGYAVVDDPSASAKADATRRAAVVLAKARVIDQSASWDGASESWGDVMRMRDPEFIELNQWGSRSALSLAVRLVGRDGDALYEHRFGIELAADDPAELMLADGDRNRRAVDGALSGMERD